MTGIARTQRMILAGLVVVASLSAPVVARAQVGGVLPILGVMVGHEEELGLSRSQIERLERLERDVARELVRRQADLSMAYLDLGAVLDDDPTKVVDVAKTEAMLKEIEGHRAGMKLVLVRATEAVKTQLTAEQRAKLATLIETTTVSSADIADPPVVPVAASGRAPHPGPTNPAPRPAPTHPGPRPGPNPGPRPPVPPRHHPAFGGPLRPRIYGGPFWWDLYWPPLPAPIVTPAPPVYVEPTPAYWYYCTSLGAYYPYVSSCPEAWVNVPATPEE
jgi:hypothetical protein